MTIPLAMQLDILMLCLALAYAFYIINMVLLYKTLPIFFCLNNAGNLILLQNSQR